jgi:hypothetical protein
MTVKELIAKLMEFPPDAAACVPQGYSPTDTVEVQDVSLGPLSERGSAPSAKCGEKVVVISS